MSGPRPLPHFRFGPYDDPPASAHSPPRYRRYRSQRFSDSPSLENNSDDGRYHYVMVEPPPQPPSTHPSLLNARREAGDGHHGDDARRTRVKRRKLDSDHARDYEPPHKYGYLGQSEPGNLRLCVLRCDGTERVDQTHPSVCLAVENVLKHDKSVFRSDKPVTRILLRHLDGTPFCLEQLHIIAPHEGFEAPVSHGSVHVAMEIHEITEHFEKSTGQNLQRSSGPPVRASIDHQRRPDSLTSISDALDYGRSASSAFMSLTDALRDPEIDAALTDIRASRTSSGRSHGYNERNVPHSDDCVHFPAYTDDDGRERDPNMPLARLTDDTPGPEDETPEKDLDYRLFRVRRMRRFTLDMDDRVDEYGISRDPTTSGASPLASNPYTRSAMRYASSGALRTHSPSPIPLPSASGVRRGSPRSDVKPESPSTSESRVKSAINKKSNAAVSAEYQITGPSNQVAIKFSPAVSGRFIVVELCSGLSTVDIQSIVAKGYGGQRFFPAREPR